MSLMRSQLSRALILYYVLLPVPFFITKIGLNSTLIILLYLVHFVSMWIWGGAKRLFDIGIVYFLISAILYLIYDLTVVTKITYIIYHILVAGVIYEILTTIWSKLHSRLSPSLTI